MFILFFAQREALALRRRHSTSLCSRASTKHLPCASAIPLHCLHARRRWVLIESLPVVYRRLIQSSSTDRKLGRSYCCLFMSAFRLYEQAGTAHAVGSADIATSESHFWSNIAQCTPSHIRHNDIYPKYHEIQLAILFLVVVLIGASCTR